LELLGRDIYIREGCVSCHSQLVRPFRSETERYGEYSKAGEYVYDHPFLWGSKRTGLDLHRVGMKYPNLWHYLHMENPSSMSPNSVMPSYPWLLINSGAAAESNKEIIALIAYMQRLGVDIKGKPSAGLNK
jgi:cytochrome c oxidase cbb3-type subunit I/II